MTGYYYNTPQSWIQTDRSSSADFRQLANTQPSSLCPFSTYSGDFLLRRRRNKFKNRSLIIGLRWSPLEFALHPKVENPLHGGFLHEEIQA